MLSSCQILESIQNDEIILSPFKDDALRGSSYLLGISNVIYVQSGVGVIDTKSCDTTDNFTAVNFDEKGFVIEPNRFYLAQSLERLTLCNNISADLSLLSSYARIGLLVNMGATHVACGYGATSPAPLTFEIFNIGRSAIILYPFVKFCHIRFFKHSSDSNVPYSGIYDKSNDGISVFSRFDLRPAK